MKSLQTFKAVKMCLMCSFFSNFAKNFHERETATMYLINSTHHLLQFTWALTLPLPKSTLASCLYKSSNPNLFWLYQTSKKIMQIDERLKCKFLYSNFLDCNFSYFTILRFIMTLSLSTALNKITAHLGNPNLMGVISMRSSFFFMLS